MTKILLTRHGHVEGILPESLRGRAELALTKKGVAEPEALRARIARAWKPAVVYTSALQRCVVTGTIIANLCGAKAIPLEGLMDIDYGAWQMRTHDEIKAEAPKAYRLWRATPQRMRFPHGETLQDLVARTADVGRLVLERHPTHTLGMVGPHNGNPASLMQVLDQPVLAHLRLI